MKDRPRLAVSAKAKKSDVTRVVRRRRTGRAVEEAGKEGKIVTLRNPEDVVLGLMRECVRVASPFRAGPLHVSDLLGKCVRKIALSEKYNKPMPSQSVSDSMGLTFAQGVAIHDYVKDRISEAHPEGIYGRWACLCGNTVTEPMVKADVPDRVCPDCGTSPHRYREVDIHDSEYGMVGSPDVIFYLSRESVYYPIEIKSIAYEEWKEIVRPKPDHVLQVLFYWYFMLRAGYSVPSQVSILYVSKGYLFKSPYKEFTVSGLTVEEVESRLETYLNDAVALKQFRDGGELPPRLNCANKASKDAKECHVCVVCFGVGG